MYGALSLIVTRRLQTIKNREIRISYQLSEDKNSISISTREKLYRNQSLQILNRCRSYPLSHRFLQSCYFCSCWSKLNELCDPQPFRTFGRMNLYYPVRLCLSLSCSYLQNVIFELVFIFFVNLN